MLRNLVIDTDTGVTRTGAPLGADIVDIVVRADVLGKGPQLVGTVFLYAGVLDPTHCQAWVGVTGGPETATAILSLRDLDTGENEASLMKQGTPGAAFLSSPMTISEPGWYALWLSTTNLKSTASLYGVHLAFVGSV